MHMYFHVYHNCVCDNPPASILTEVRIAEFMEFYRATFPTASVIPKLHLLEDHILPFLKMWKVGFGLLGEQGAESIHTVFNNLKRVYGNIHNREEKLRLVTQEHLPAITNSVCPNHS